jgi:eukaryotic-like serine/threonine-protein kinase
MGVVYQAAHAMLRRPTALKLLQAGHDDDEHAARFEREVQLTSQLTHPNTIAVYDYGRTPEGVLYYAMEYIEGIDFEHLVEHEGPLPPGRVVFLLEQVLGALGEAHSIGLIHRDIKPANLMVCRRGGLADFVKVLDFGLAKQLSGAVDISLGEALVGTPHYLAPESIRGKDVGPAADLYALGAVAYFMLTGRTVFEGSSVVEIGVQHLEIAPMPPSERGGRPIPPSLEKCVLRCLAKDPAARPASAAALAKELAALSDFEPWTQDDAERWWDERGSPMLQGIGSHRKPAGSTMGIDVRRRSVASLVDVEFADTAEVSSR